MAKYTAVSELEVHQLLLLELISRVLCISNPITELRSSFVSLGGNSIKAISLSTALRHHGISLSVSSILMGRDLSELLDAVLAKAESQTSHKKLEIRNDFSHLPHPPICPQHVSIVREPIDISERYHVDEQATTNCHQLERSYPVSEKGRDLRHEGPETLATAVYPRFSGAKKHRFKGFDDSQTCPMTEMQLLMVHGSSKEPSSNVISFRETYKLSDLPAVKRAWEMTILGEASLHVEMRIEGDGGVVRDRLTPEFRWLEVCTDNEHSYLQEIRELPCSSIVAVGFKVVIRDHGWYGASTATVIWRIHHALIDGYSASLVYHKFQLALQGKPSAPGRSFIGVARQLLKLQRERADVSRAFWQARRARFPEASGQILLPLPLPGRASTEKLSSSVAIDSPIEDIRMACRDLDCTLAAFYCAAWSLVLSRYTASDSVVFGLVYSGRGLPLTGAEDVTGPLISTLPLHVDIEGSTSVAAFVREVFGSMNLLGEVQFSRAEDGFDRKFSSALAMEFGMEPLPDTTVRPLGRSQLDIISDLPLSVCVFETGRIQISYRTSSFREADILALARHFENIQTLLLDPHRSIEYCLDHFMDPVSRQKLLRAGNCGLRTTSPGYSSDTLVTLFDKTVASQPNSVALEKGSQLVTYRDLQAAAKQLAHSLKKEVRPGETVCVLADRSVNWIVAIYACLYLGAVYAPIDPALPLLARERNFEISGSRLFLIPSAERALLEPKSVRRRCFSVEDLLSTSKSSELLEDLPKPAFPESAAYVCFTSGSTGIPKAVLCTHEGLVAFQRDSEVRLFAGPGARIAQIMSPAFDGSIHELFSSLSYGATLLLSSSEIDLVNHLGRATTALMTPTLCKALEPDDFPDLQNVYLVGEPVPQAVCDKWAKSKRLYNMYGPTEGTGGATVSKLSPGKPVTIGRPNPSSRVYILDAKQRILPPSVIGEIYIAGVQVARGYVGHPEATAANFLEDTICPRLNEMMYRTGDMGYWTSSGDICCIGRRDRQVKLGGFRLDLNDLEYRLAEALPEATGVAIARQKDWLVALVQSETLSVETIKRRATAIFQPQAMPRRFMAVKKFPTTAIGKVDYAAIAQLEFVGNCGGSPSMLSETQARLATIWRDILKIPKDMDVDGDTNFLALGGGSISQLLLFNRISSLTKLPPDMRSVLDVSSKGSLSDLAQLLESADPNMAPSSQYLAHVRPSKDTTPSRKLGVTGELLGNGKLSSGETQWYYRYKLDDQSQQFNVSLGWQIDREKVDVTRLRSALERAVQRYPIFDSKFVEVGDGAPVRLYGGSIQTVVTAAHTLDAELEVNRPFRLGEEGPIRIFVGEHLLLLIASHIVCDLCALRQLLRDVEEIYAGRELEPVPRQYIDMSHETTNTIGSSTVSYWDEILRPAVRLRQMRLLQETRASCQGTSLTVNLGPTAARDVSALARSYRLTSHQVAVAVVGLMLRACHGTSATANTGDILVGGPYLSRKHEDARVIGLFLEPLPIVMPSDDAILADAPTYLNSVQRACQSALVHATGWARCLQHFHIPLDSPSHQLFDAMVTFHESDPGEALRLPGLKPVLVWPQGAKFRLMAEFTALGEDALLLRLEAAHSVFSEEQMQRVAAGIECSLEMLAAGNIGGTAAALETLVTARQEKLIGRRVAFGTVVENLAPGLAT